MATTAFEPRHLDVAALASAKAQVAGEFALDELQRLMLDALPPAPGESSTAVVWSAQGERRAVAGCEPEIRLKLRARAVLQLRCQRCLQEMPVTLDIRPVLRFVQGEDAAAGVDADSEEEDVLPLSPTLDLRELIEDELILALPLVPRHARCEQPLPMSAGDLHEAEGSVAANPFAALAALRRTGGHGGG